MMKTRPASVCGVLGALRYNERGIIMNNNERFRVEFAARLNLPPDELKIVLRAYDSISCDYDITRKSTAIIQTGVVPETVKIYIAAKAVESLSKGTLNQYRWKLTNFFETVRKRVEDIDANDIRLYLFNFKQERGVDDRYIDNIRVTLNGFFTWLVNNDYVQKNPCAKVARIRFTEKQREPLTQFELESVRWACQTVREKAIVDFLFSTGCRVSECTGVRLSDINWHDRSVLIRHGKGDKERLVFFNAECDLSLKKYLETRTDGNDFLFVSDKRPNNPLQRGAIERIIRAIGKRAEIRVFPHRLRHTFATSGLNGGMTLPTLQKLLGHTKPETTMIYAHMNTTDIQREHQRVYA